MTPKHFIGLAAVAAVSLIAAIAVYSSSVNWSHARASGAPLFASLRGNVPKIARIEVEQHGDKLTLEHKGNDWLLKERDGFPATPEKVRSFLVSLSDAELVEEKTSRKDRYPLLALEDPASKDANSHLVRLIDDKGHTVAEAIIGKQRRDAFGSGKGGTYVRRPGEAQTWLVNTEIDPGTDLRHWAKLSLFKVNKHEIKSMRIQVPGKDDVNIALAPDASEYRLQDIPDGMKVKYVNSIDDIAEAAGSIDFDDVRKLTATPTGDKVSTVTLKLANGVTCVFKIRRDGGVAWISMETSGEGDAKIAAAALMARAKGWQFRVPKSTADAILKTRDELLEKKASS